MRTILSIECQVGYNCTPVEILVSDDLRPIEDEKSESYSILLGN